MKSKSVNFGNMFLLTALVILLSGLIFGLLAALIYLFPDFLKKEIGFIALRPLHVSSAMFWIILGATGCVYNGLPNFSKGNTSRNLSLIHWLLWIVAVIGIYRSYFHQHFGGREYWEFDPIWALPIAVSWLLFFINFIRQIQNIRRWPVYIWMWLTGILFFMFVFIENYLWLFPYFRESFVKDMTIQWKVNGSLVGALNQILYGTAFYLMDKITNSKKVGQNKFAFAMYFLGLTNLMFNWGHHIYTLPTEKYIRYLGYLVSMTEWIFFAKIIYSWKSTVTTIQKNYHYLPYRFLMASDIWVFINMGQAILMSIPAINLFTHGTHITVAHAMGTTIGINTMILLAACFEFLSGRGKSENSKKSTGIDITFWSLQISLLGFWLSLLLAGIQKGLWQLSEHQPLFSKMQASLRPYFISFAVFGALMLISFFLLIVKLLKDGLLMKKIS